MTVSNDFVPKANIVQWIELHLRALMAALTVRSDMPNANRSAAAATKCHNRIAAIMAHTSRYAFRGTCRLAADACVSKSTISYLVRGQTIPLFPTARSVVNCLERALNRRLDYDEVLSPDGSYPTVFVCQLVGCTRCLPDAVYESDGSRKAAFADTLSGQWTGDVDEFGPGAHAAAVEEDDE